MSLPLVHYNWYMFDVDTIVVANFVAFTTIVYKNFGGFLYDLLAADGKQIIAEQNAAEDEFVRACQEKLDIMKLEERCVQDAEDVFALKEATYVKLQEAGKIKPQYEFKQQIERLMGLMVPEEATLREKRKVALMAEATEAVTAAFGKSEKLKKSALDIAIAQLKGGGAPKSDPVKNAYMQFFRSKAKASEQMDEAAEIAESRKFIVTKLNAVASNEKFFFRFDADGKPKMVEE